jgi:ABC-type branched-subunit amino acid transport system substrate-binding protein
LLVAGIFTGLFYLYEKERRMNVRKFVFILVSLSALMVILSGCQSASTTAATSEFQNMPSVAETDMATPEPTAVEAAKSSPQTESTEASMPTETPVAEALAPLKIGVAVDLSGQLAPYGQDLWQGLQLGLAYATDDSMSVAGHPLELVMRDTNSDVQTGAAVVEELLVDEQIDIFVGPTSSAISLSTQALTQQMGLVNFVTAGAPNFTGAAWNQNTFRVCHILPPDGPVVSTSSAGPVTTEFLDNDLISQRLPDEIGTLGLISYHYDLPKTPANAWLVEQHQAQYGEVPDLETECGFSTAQAIVAALQATNGDPSAGQMIPALEGLQFEGVKGQYTIRAADHQVLAPLYIVRLTSVDDPEQHYFELVEEITDPDAVYACNAPNCN